MLLLSSAALPEGDNWVYEPKLDGYRALGIKSDGAVRLRSKNNKDFSRKYPAITEALHGLPEETVIDGEIVAFDEFGKPSFSALQNYGPTHRAISYFVFDVLILEGQNVMVESLAKRGNLLRARILPNLQDPIRECLQFNVPLPHVIDAVRELGLEGVVAKNLAASYEPGRRSGSWRKMRINKGQEFVIGGYTRGPKNFDAVIFGYYEGSRLLYAGRTRNGFTSSLREKLYQQFHKLEISDCPFANLPEKREGRWGLGLTIEKMKDCRWLQPKLVGEFEFVEWTPDNHLRHSHFRGLREDVTAHAVRREP